MSTAVQQLLAAFDTLPDDEQDVVIAELLARHPLGAGDLSETTFEALADELFLAYDAAEGTDAAPPG